MRPRSSLLLGRSSGQTLVFHMVLDVPKKIHCTLRVTSTLCNVRSVTKLKRHCQNRKKWQRYARRYAHITVGDKPSTSLEPHGQALSFSAKKYCMAIRGYEDMAEDIILESLAYPEDTRAIEHLNFSIQISFWVDLTEYRTSGGRRLVYVC